MDTLYKISILESIGTEQNDARLNEAEEHVVELEGQAGEFGSILTGAKEPAARSLQAAQAYDNIAKAMAEAEERAEEARNDAEESLRSKVVGFSFPGLALRCTSLSLCRESHRLE